MGLLYDIWVISDLDATRYNTGQIARNTDIIMQQNEILIGQQQEQLRQNQIQFRYNRLKETDSLKLAEEYYKFSDALSYTGKDQEWWNIYYSELKNRGLGSAEQSLKKEIWNHGKSLLEKDIKSKTKTISLIIGICSFFIFNYFLNNNIIIFLLSLTTFIGSLKIVGKKLNDNNILNNYQDALKYLRNPNIFKNPIKKPLNLPK